MFNFEITPLSNLFFILTILVFSSLFIVKNNNRNIFLHLLLFISLSTIFYANNFITFFIGWEVMSWSSYFIISSTASQKTLQKYIVFNLTAGFALLGAIVLIYGFCDTFIYKQINFSLVPQSYSLIISILFIVAIFIKSGVIPFHYWVVDTYNESNHIFSAVLSAIISKVGIFAFILIFTQIITIQNIEPKFLDIIAWAGVFTSIIATFKAISQDDIKKLLAYSSIAQIGYIITILAIFTSSAIESALYHTIIHTAVKLLLFINIGAIIYISGKTKFSQLGGLLYKYPINFIFLVIGIITLAGIPTLGGFSSKFLIYTTLLEEKKALLLVAVMFSSASSFLYCYKLVYGIYLGQSTNEIKEYKNIPFSFYIPQIIGAIIVIILGIFPAMVVPVFNDILISLGFEAVEYISVFELNSTISSFNGSVVTGVFTGLFILILIIFMNIKSKVVKVKDRYDISYCGEIPKNNINLHYGYGMAQELKRIGFIKIILENSSSILWDKIQKYTNDSSSMIKKLHSLSTQNISILFLLFFTILLFIGVG